MLLRIIVEIVSRKYTRVNDKFTVKDSVYKKLDYERKGAKTMANLVVGVLTMLLAACAGVRIL